jgi:alkenylglycerophosphocholine/alkenylglycerophosphoethanolamine hydrolase
MKKLLLLALLSAIAMIIGLYIDNFTLRILTKPIPIICFGLWALNSGTSKYSKTIAISLFICSIADIFLEFKTNNKMFLIGMLFFGLGHAGYILAFLNKTKKLNIEFFLPFLIWGGSIMYVLHNKLGPMLIPVGVYSILLVSMMWRALSLLKVWSWKSEVILIPIGAIIFAISDTLIALDKFNEPISYVRYPIIITYYVAQFLLAFSVTILKNREASDS